MRFIHFIFLVSLSFCYSYQAFSNEGSFPNQSKTPPEVDQSSSVNEDESFIRALRMAYEVFKNPEISNKDKTDQMTALFQMADAKCVHNCEVILRVLGAANAAMNSPTVEQVIQSIRQTFPNERAQSTLNKIDTARKVAEALSKLDPQVLRYRLSAALQLSRYLLSLREQLLFESLTAGNISAENQATLTNDVELLKKQIRGLKTIFEILATKYNYSTDAIKGVSNMSRTSDEEEKERVKEEAVSQLMKVALTPEESQRIAEAVLDLNLLVFSKVIQMISNNSILLGPEARGFFRSFQDRMPQAPSESVLQVIREDFGKEASELFIDFDANHPIASATVGQTYKAKVRTWWGGTKEVIVKVQREGVAESLSRNRALDQVLLMGAKIAIGSEQRDSLLDLLTSQVVGFEDAIEHELNYEAELKQLERAHYIFQFYGGIQVPKPMRTRSSRRVLTMEVIPGQNIDHVAEQLSTTMNMANEDNGRISEQIFKKVFGAFLYQMLILGEVHGDMHPGNILAGMNGQVGLIDWSHLFRSRGLVTEPVKLFYHIMTGHADEIARVFSQMNRGNSFESNEFSFEVQKILDAHQVPSTTFTHFFNEGRKYVDGPKTLRMLGELYQAAQRKGFVASPKYFQFSRTTMPVVSVLFSLSSSLPKGRASSIMLREIIWAYPAGAVRAGMGLTWNQISRPQRYLNWQLDRLADEVRQRLQSNGPVIQIQRCEALF